jgi:hypothetical protein
MAALAGVTALSLGVMETQERRVGQLRLQLRGYQADYAQLARQVEADARRTALSEPFFGSADTRQIRGRLAAILPVEQLGQLDDLQRLVLDLSRTLDSDLDGALKRVEQALRRPAELVRELADERIRGFDEALRRNVELLELEGRTAEAAALVLDRLRATFGGAREEGTAFQRAMAEAGKAVRSLWEEVKPGIEAGGTALLGWFTASIGKAQEFRAAMGTLSLGERLTALAGVLPGGTPATTALLFREGQRRGGQGDAATMPGVPPPTGERGARARQAFDFFVAQGWSPAQAAGIVANLDAESGLHHDAAGDSGRAFGLAQWHPDRQAAFARFAERGIRGASFEQQLAFVHHELTAGPERAAGERLRGAASAAEAGAIVSRFYERPAAGEFAARGRAQLAEGFARRFAAAEPMAAAPGAQLPGQAAAAAAAQAGGIGSDAARTGPVAAASRFVDDALRDAHAARPLPVQAEDLEAQVRRFERARGAVAAGSEAYRVFTARIEQLRAAQAGLEQPIARTIRGLRESREAAEADEGATRELVQARQQLREVARQQGRELRPGEEAQAEAEVLARLAAERRDQVDLLDRQIGAEQRIADTWRTGAAAAQEVEARERAREEVRATTLRGTPEEARAVEELTQRYLALS